MLDPAIRPSVVLMNPPFSASPHVEGRFAEAAIRHLASAFARLAEGGRLVAITGHNVGPDEPAWRDGFVRLQEEAAASCSRAAIAGQAYARHGTTIETRLTVIDRVPADDPRALSAVARQGRRLPPSCSIGSSAWCRRAPALAAPSAAPVVFYRHGSRRSRARRNRRRAARLPTPARRRRTSSSSPTRPATGRRPSAAA